MKLGLDTGLAGLADGIALTVGSFAEETSRQLASPRMQLQFA